MESKGQDDTLCMEEDLNLHILRRLEDTILLDVAHVKQIISEKKVRKISLICHLLNWKLLSAYLMLNVPLF